MVTRARVAHLLVVLLGLLVALYPVTEGAQPEVSCRGVTMRPGDSCAKADNSAVQTYEQRLRAANQARPVIFGVGILVVAFGTALLVADVRRRRPEASPQR